LQERHLQALELQMVVLVVASWGKRCLHGTAFRGAHQKRFAEVFPAAPGIFDLEAGPAQNYFGPEFCEYHSSAQALLNSRFQARVLGEDIPCEDRSSTVGQYFSASLHNHAKK
jgi:hypothetical protein